MFGSALTMAGEQTCYCVSEPDSVSVCLGTAVSFSVTASGEGRLAYQWYHDSTALDDGGRIAGATSNRLQIGSVESGDVGEYTVSVTGARGSVTSAAATLKVKAQTVIASHPDDASVCLGTAVSFSVTASGEGKLAYQWYHDSTALNEGGRISGVTSSQLQISNVEDADAGEYTVSVIGGCGEAISSAVTLTVKAVTVIIAQPETVSVYSGTDVSFSVAGSGEGKLAYQWYHGSIPLNEGGRIAGATSNQLEISNVEDADAGEYTVSVTGGCGEVTSSIAKLDVRQPIGNLGVVPESEPRDVLIVLDLSSSMEEEVSGGTKIALAKDALQQLLTTLPGETQVGLRTFRSCGRSDLEVPIQAISTGQILATVQGLETAGRTPLAYTLRQIPSDLQGLKGPHVIVFITDGTETCDEDPAAAARELAASTPDIIFRLVGFDIERLGGQWAIDQLQGIADAAGGLYVNVETGGEFLSAVLSLVLPPNYRVYDSAGNLVKEGVVGEAPFELPAGTYSVVVQTDPQSRFEDVTIEPDKTVILTATSN